MVYSAWSRWQYHAAAVRCWTTRLFEHTGRTSPFRHYVQSFLPPQRAPNNPVLEFLFFLAYSHPASVAVLCHSVVCEMLVALVKRYLLQVSYTWYFSGVLSFHTTSNIVSRVDELQRRCASFPILIDPPEINQPAIAPYLKGRKTPLLR